MNIHWDKETWLIIATAAGAIGTIVGPIISWFLTKEHHQKAFKESQEKSLADIGAQSQALIRDGEWKGISIVDRGPTEFLGQYSISIQLRVENDNIICGEYKYWVDASNPKPPKKHTPPATLNVRGGFNGESFLILWLQSPNPDNVHFGIAILELSTDRRHFHGIWVAFGLHAGEFVAGTFKVDKV